MKKLIQGILEFRRSVFPAYRLTFSRLASSQSPDCLFIACADSRVVPNLFASTHPGDLFVVRNVGNLVAPAPVQGVSPAECSTGAALEFAVLSLGVSDIVVCGHSNCGAMKGLLAGRDRAPSLPPHLSAWLENGAMSLERHQRGDSPTIAGREDLPEHDRLSLMNVLAQLDHVASHPFVRERVEAGTLRLHGWWFDVGSADVYTYERDQEQFVLIDETAAARLQEQMA